MLFLFRIFFICCFNANNDDNVDDFKLHRLDTDRKTYLYFHVTYTESPIYTGQSPLGITALSTSQPKYLHL